MITDILKTLIEKISTHKSTSLASLGVASYFLYKYLTYEIPEIPLSRFLLLLKNNSIEECIVQGSKVYFKGINTEKWFLVNVGMLTKEMVFKLLLKQQDIIVRSRNPQDLGKWISIGLCKIFIFNNGKFFFN